MRTSLLMLVCLWCLPAFAQVKIKDQQGKPYFEKVEKWCQGKMLEEADLLALNGLPAVASFEDTLKKYDWYSLGGYYYYEKTYSQNFSPNGQGQAQYDFFRVMPDNKVANFALSRHVKGDVNITTTAFDKNTASIYRFKKVNNLPCIEVETYGEKAYLTIISYQNGILVLDNPQTGTAGSKEIKRFREVYRAVPQSFKWDW